MQEKDTIAIAALEAELERAVKSGREQLVLPLWERLHKADPDHTGALLALGQRAFRNGDPARARSLLQRLTEVDGRDQQQFINLAVVCQALKDEEGEAAAIKGALTIDPSDMLALILRGNLLERQGKVHGAAAAYGAVANMTPDLEQINPNLRAAVARAHTYRDGYNQQFGAYMDAFLAPRFKDMQGEPLGRFRESVDIMFGRKKRYESQSHVFHYHGLAPISFFERGDFPWLDGIEASTDAIRDEFLAVLQAEEGFTPYLTYDVDQPHNQWAELNNSPRWSAFHLIKDGMRVEQNAGRCPQTMAALAGAPLPDQPGRTPAAMYSLLKPQTRIPPHTGVSNVRLVTHLPLIVPAGCGFRVGNDVREWVPGKAWVFDDTIEHEAWNNSDKLRVVLIFDIWHPHLNAAERAMITAMADGIKAFSAEEGGFAL